VGVNDVFVFKKLGMPNLLAQKLDISRVC